MRRLGGLVQIHPLEAVFVARLDLLVAERLVERSAAANPWEVKLGPGRMMDIELLAQSGALIHNLAGLRQPRRMLAALGDCGWLDPDAARTLSEAHGRLAALQQFGRLASDHTIDPREGGAGLVQLLLAVTETADLDSTCDLLEASATRSAELISARLAAP